MKRRRQQIRKKEGKEERERRYVEGREEAMEGKEETEGTREAKEGREKWRQEGRAIPL